MSDVVQLASQSIDASGCRRAEPYARKRTIGASGMQNGGQPAAGAAGVGFAKGMRAKTERRQALDLQGREGARPRDRAAKAALVLEASGESNHPAKMVVLAVKDKMPLRTGNDFAG